LDGRQLILAIAKIPLTIKTASDFITSVSGSSRSNPYRNSLQTDDSDYDWDEEKKGSDKMSDGESSSSSSGTACAGLPPPHVTAKWKKENLSEEEILHRRFDYSVRVCRVPTNDLESGRMTEDELVMLEAKQEVS